MNIKQMKFMDKYPGFAAVALLSALNRLFASRETPCPDKRTVRKLLVMKFWGLGSILLLSPTIGTIRREMPSAKLVLFTSMRNKEICDALGLFDEVVMLDVDHGWLRFLASFLKNVLYLMCERFDMVIDFEFFTRFSAVVTFFTFAKIKVGYHAWETWRGNIHNIKVPFNRYWHIMDNFYNLGNYIGLEKHTGLTMVKPRVTEADKRRVEELLADRGITGGFISVHVNASDLVIERRWPYESFVELIRRLLARHRVSVIFIGSRTEAASVKDIVASVGSPLAVDLVDKLSLTQLASLFERSRFVISNDSGPLHLAVAMGTPTISFFGPETPVIYGPRGDNHTVFFKGIDCSPCVNVHDRKSVHCYWTKPKCMTAITVDEALEAIESRFSREGGDDARAS